jgi:uncharacterized membrane protein
MAYSPILIGHICAGTLGLLSGTAAMSFRKGSPRHVLAGKVFVASMLTMAVAAEYLAIVRHQPNNIGGGILTFYLIGTAWLTARRRDGETSRFDWVVLLIPLVLGVLTWMNGIKIVRSGASSQDGVPVGMTFFMGSAHGTEVKVLDADNFTVVGSITGLKPCHGVALVPELNEGFITDGDAAAQVVVFDMRIDLPILISNLG